MAIALSDCCRLHDNIVSSLTDGYTIIKKHTQNKWFAIIKKTLFVIDYTNLAESCAICGKRLNLYLYGEWPNVRASFDGVTDLPIIGVIPGIKKHIMNAHVHTAPNLGSFIYCELTRNILDATLIMYNPSKHIEEVDTDYILVDGIPAFCFESISGGSLLINSNCEVIEMDISYREYGKDLALIDMGGIVMLDLGKTPYIFKIGNGQLNYIKDESSIIWTYTSAPALNTKPAAASARADDE